MSGLSCPICGKPCYGPGGADRHITEDHFDGDEWAFKDALERWESGTSWETIITQNGYFDHEFADVIREAETVTATAVVETSRGVDARFEAAVEDQIHRIRVREEAKRRAASDALHDIVLPDGVWTLADDLQVERPEHRYVIDRLHPIDGNALMIAQRKTGKTTLELNLARALIRGEPFLDRFDVQQVDDGRVAFWNYELGPHMFAEWAEGIGIAPEDRLATLHLRGINLRAWLPQHAEWAIAWHRRHETRYWIVDPFGAAWIGLVQNENDSAQLRQFTAALDYIKREAEIPHLLGTHHAGWSIIEGNEHGRGGSGLEDWPDAIWYLTSDEEGQRSLKAIGRDVDLPATEVNYDTVNRRLYAGLARNDRQKVKHMIELCNALFLEPGLTSGALAEHSSGSQKDRNGHVKAAVREGYVERRLSRDDPGSVHDEAGKPPAGVALYCFLTDLGRSLLEQYDR